MNEFGNQRPDKQLERLLRLAGPRPAPSAQLHDEVYASVHQTWRLQHRRSMRRRRLVQLALAASVVAGVTLTLWLTRPSAPAVATAMATVERSVGDVSREVDHGWQPLAPGDSVDGATRLRTGGDGRVALRLRDGTSLRLASQTELGLAGLRALHLAGGKVYLDTAQAQRRASFEVTTRSGVVRNVGTQFEVYSDADLTRVRVRDGEVVLETAAESLHARRGEALITARDGRIQRRRFPTVDAGWDWVQELASVFETDGARVSELADWAARETGRRVVYADVRTRNAATLTRISGSIAGLAPEQTLAAALAATRFAASIEGERILIARDER